ncbi:hypothetical protein EJ06DRAFT_146745 [Trichodelitschia bisporula]|uniref:Uncharacterized protein n=1 Tax=Trichodelitschia bisporula TaxID=703511 RepID=A0A6G1HMY1_9PEZI|nr:hypothetical protein EJ06DRAFT_146745 [Trichodelitschia bisporula]
MSLPQISMLLRLLPDITMLLPHVYIRTSTNPPSHPQTKYLHPSPHQPATSTKTTTVTAHVQRSTACHSPPSGPQHTSQSIYRYSMRAIPTHCVLSQPRVNSPVSQHPARSGPAWRVVHVYTRARYNDVLWYMRPAPAASVTRAYMM